MTAVKSEAERTSTLNRAIEQLDFAALDPSLVELMRLLLNEVEWQGKLIKELRSENQQLRDENNRLKGEQGKPSIRPQTQTDDISSEAERKNLNLGQPKQSKAKNHKIKINRVEKCTVDKGVLPADAVFKGCRSVIVQDIVIHTDNVQFEREIYYSPSLKKTFVGALPRGYEGEFGPGVKAFILISHYQSNMTESAILATLQTHGVLISASTVSNILTDNKEAYHQEKQDIVKAGLSSVAPKQMDDTSARVKGKNYVAHILCNDMFTSYFTRVHKDRLTVLEILNMGPLTFKFNDLAYGLMKKLKLSAKWIESLQQRQFVDVLNRKELDVLLVSLFPDPQKHSKSRQVIMEASAIAAYQGSAHAVPMILTDEAPQFNELTEEIASCWIHEGRHYKKLAPQFKLHQIYLDTFLTRFWNYYHELLAYKESPHKRKAKRLSKKFDQLFSATTGYEELDKRIALTKARKDSLLLVLRHPALPLHNNASELGARVQARKRDISFHTMSAKGTEAKDTFMTIVETAKKHGVNVYHYLYDRITQKYAMPSLASLINATGSNGPTSCLVA